MFREVGLMIGVLWDTAPCGELDLVICLACGECHLPANTIIGDSDLVSEPSRDDDRCLSVKGVREVGVGIGSL